VIKARSKKVSLLLVFMMLATLFIGVGTASASTDNVALTIPSVGTSGDNVTLGTIKVTETDSTTGSIVAGQQITVTLPTGVEYEAAATSSDLADYVGTSGLTLKYVSSGTKTLTVEIASRTADSSTNAALYFYFNKASKSQVSLDGPNSDIAVEIYAPNSGISNGKVINATSSSAGTTTTVLDDSTVSNSTGTQEVGTIRIAENRAASLKTGDEIKIIAPDDVDIKTTNSTDYINYANWVQSSYDLGTNSDGDSQLTLKVVPTTAGATPGFVNVKLMVSVTDSDLTGPITFTVKGDNVTTQKVTVGTIGDYDASVVAKGDPKTVKAGASDQEIQDMTVKELIKGSFLKNRDFTWNCRIMRTGIKNLPQLWKKATM